MRNALFIHIPKTAGFAVSRALGLKVFKRGINDRIKPEEIGEHFDGKTGQVTFRHALYHNLVDHGVFSEDFRYHSYKFCFSRNPYDRAVSHWAFTMKKHPDRLAPGTSFLEFTRVLGKRTDWIPQFTWVHGVNFNYIGRFETLEDDIKKIGKDIGVEVKEIPVMNTSKHGHYSTYYCDESRERVDKYYHVDFKMFGYQQEIALESQDAV